MAWTKLQTALVVTAVLALAASTTTVTIKKITESHDYSWQVAKPTYAMLTNARPQVTILPSKFNRTFGLDRGDGKGNTIESLKLDVTVKDMIQIAYAMRPVWTVYATPLPSEKFDFIVNIPDGGMDLLRKTISSKFDLQISRQTRETNILVLSVRAPNAAGLKPTTEDGAFSPGRGYFSGQGRGAIDLLASSIADNLRIPVLNETGLPSLGFFAIDLKWDAAQGRTLEPLNEALMTQLGLELTLTNRPVEMLVVEKAR